MSKKFKIHLTRNAQNDLEHIFFYTVFYRTVPAAKSIRWRVLSQRFKRHGRAL